MRIFLIGMAVILLLLGTVDLSYTGEGGKIGYIDLSKTFDEYEKTKELDKKLEKTGDAKQAEREKMAEEIKRLEDKLELTGEKAKEKKQEEINEKIKELQNFDRETRTDLRRERDNMVRDILQEIDKVIREYGGKEGYSLILNDRVLLYGSKELDLTHEILKILNGKYKR